MPPKAQPPRPRIGGAQQSEAATEAEVKPAPVYGIWLPNYERYWRDNSAVVFNTPSRAVALAQLAHVLDFNSRAAVREFEE